MTALGQIGPFTLSEILGQGGMATVYSADHPDFGRVALRVIRKHASRLQTEIVEAERMGALQHILLSDMGCPCVPKAYPPYEDPAGSYFCVPVEYIDGQTLAHKIEDGPFPEAEALRIAIAICRNLQCAHRVNATLEDGRVVDHIVHGDLKPANIMIDVKNDVKVLDYGISKPILDQKTATRQVFGAACYSSPERLDQKKFDLHTDLWAIGVMLYEMVAGQRPFEGNEVEVRQAFLEGRRPPPLRNASEGFQAVVYKALSYERELRYASADSLLADLERIEQGVPPAAIEGKPEQNDRTVRAPIEVSVANATLPAPDPATLTTREPLRGKPFSKSKRAFAHKPASRSQVVAMILLALIGVSMASGAVVFWHEYRLVQEAKGLRSDLERKADISLNDWKAYENLSERSWTRVPPREPANVIKQRYKEYAGRALKDYREGLSRALTGQRRQTAELYLGRVLDLDPTDKKARSMMLVMQAYGIPMKSDDNGRKAIDLLEQAARADSNSADPYLGIARFSVYSLRDPDRAAAALEAARKRGYVEVDRDHALMADGYRYQAMNLWRSAKRVGCEDVDKDLVRRIQELLERSIDLYRRIPQFSGTQAGLESARTTLDEVESSCPHSSWWKVWEKF